MCGNLRPAFHAGLSVGRGTPVFGEAAGAVTSPGSWQGACQSPGRRQPAGPDPCSTRARVNTALMITGRSAGRKPGDASSAKVLSGAAGKPRLRVGKGSPAAEAGLVLGLDLDARVLCHPGGIRKPFPASGKLGGQGLPLIWRWFMLVEEANAPQVIKQKGNRDKPNDSFLSF